MIGVKVCGFLAERFFVTDGNIAAYVNKNAATLICRPHLNISGCGVRRRASEEQGGEQGEDGLDANIFAGHGPRTDQRRDNNDDLDGGGENDLFVVLLVSVQRTSDISLC
jgi:hypothetical protein